MDNTKAITSFLFGALAMLCLLLSQEHYDELHDRSGKIVPKVAGGGGPQFLKALTKNLWVGVPMLDGVPHGCFPTPDNTLLVDENLAKSILNPPGNAIFLDPWKCDRNDTFPDPWKCDRNDTFLENELGPYIKRLACHPGSVPNSHFQSHWQ